MHWTIIVSLTALVPFKSKSSSILKILISLML
nr:MAG TPA_asm: hypothetical protein [Caudoviricetes sp.]